MATPFLALNVTTDTTPQVRRYVSGAPAIQGVTLSALETFSAPDATNQHHQRVCRFASTAGSFYDAWIACVGSSIFRSTNQGASYTTVFGPDTDLGTVVSKAGPYVLYVNGVPKLVILARNSSSSWRLFTSTDGVTWSKIGPFTITDPGDMSIQAVTEWRGSLYGFTSGVGSNGYTLVWSDTSVAQITGGPLLNFGIGNQTAFAVFNDKLCALGIGAGGSYANRSLYELTGGAWTVRDDVFLAVSNPTTNTKYALFVDPLSNVLVGIMLGVVGVAGYRAFTWDDTLLSAGRTEITSAINIQSLLGSAPASIRIATLTDLPDPGSGAAPTVYIYVAQDGVAGTTFSVWKWNGAGSPLTSVGSGGNVQHAMPFGVQNGGSVFWTAGQRHVERISATPVIGGVRYGFKIYSPNASVDAVSVRFLRGTKNDEFPKSPFATLSNPSAGTLGAGNTQIDGLDAANNGTTTFFVTWAAGTDGFSIGDFAKTTPEIFS